MFGNETSYIFTFLDLGRVRSVKLVTRIGAERLWLE